ncbi:MAG: MarR family transcriptional regulator [Thermoplasmata archaeon]
MVGPEELLLAFLQEPRSDARGVTQRDLVRHLGLSQPGVSRSLRGLCARGWVQAVRSGTWTGRSPERLYALTDSGRRAAPAARAQLLEMPSSVAGFTVRDLAELNAGTSALELALVSLWKIPLDPTDPAAAIDQLHLERGSSPRPRGATGGAPLALPEPSLVGHARERSILFDSMRALRGMSPRGGSLLLVGAAGIGKTRLLQFARQVARARDLPVLERHLSVGQGPALTPLGSLAFDRFGARVLPAPVTRGRTAGSVVAGPLDALRSIETMAADRPLLVLLDDLHRAPREAIEFFRLLSHSIRQRDLPILLVASARDEPPEPVRNGLPRLLAETKRAPDGPVRTLRVGPLSDAEARRLAEELRAGRPPDRLVREVLVRARGNPLFVIEGIRDVAERERGREPSGPALRRTLREVPVPPSLQRLLLDRLRLLPPRERAVLGVASVLGEEFEVEPLVEVGAAHGLGSESEIVRALRGLAGRYRFLDRAGRRRYSFAHPVIFLTARETFDGQLDWSDRFARWWEAHRPTDLSRLARLCHDARDSERGVGWVDRAIDRAVETHAWSAVAVLLQWRRDLAGQLPRPADRGSDREWEVLGRMWLLGAARETTDVLRDYLELPISTARRTEAECLLINALAAVDPSEARRRLLRLETERGRAPPGPKLERGRLAAARAFQEIQAGEWEEAERVARTAAGLLPEVEDPGTRAWALYSWGVALMHLNRLEEAGEVCRRARALATRNDLASLLSLTADTEARIRLVAGDPEGALPLLAEAESFARRIDSSVQSARLLANRALAEIRLHRWDDALRTTDALRELSEQLDLSVHAAWTEYRYGQIALGQGRWSEAERRLTSAAAEFERMGLAVPRDLSRIQLAVVRGELGRPGEALEIVDRLEGQVARMDADERPALAGIRGRLLELLGRFSASEAAYRQLLGESERGGDPARRAEALAALARLESVRSPAARGRGHRHRAHAQRDELEVPLSVGKSTVSEEARPSGRGRRTAATGAA